MMTYFQGVLSPDNWFHQKLIMYIVPQYKAVLFFKKMRMLLIISEKGCVGKKVRW